MAVIDRTTLKSWFVKGAKPLASQFASWIDSFVHVTDTVPAAQISGLADELNLKADVTSLEAEAQMRSDADTALQSLLNQGANGTSYVVVKGSGTAAENATELVNAYNKATTMTPYGNALSHNNRVVLLLFPGNYDITANFAFNRSFVDFVAVGEGVYFNFIDTTGVYQYQSTYIIADDIRLKGIDFTQKVSVQLRLQGDYPNLYVEKCTGGDGFMSTIDNTNKTSGIFVRCIGGKNSFSPNASGTFIDCTAGSSSDDGGSFGALEATGTFINCTCLGPRSFGMNKASGNFINCTGGDLAFGVTDSSGVFENCTGGASSFSGGSQVPITGTFTRCVVNDPSWGMGYGSRGHYLTGTLLYCILNGGLFVSPPSGGKIIGCVDKSNTLITLTTP